MQATTQQHMQDISIVLGLGATGVSCLKFLSDTTRLVACDDHLDIQRKEELQSEFPKVQFTSTENCMELTGITEVIASPGISDEHPIVAKALKKSVPVVCDIEIFARKEIKPVIAITGTNGKSTVVSWLAHVLNAMDKKSVLAGNIGIPALSVVEQEHDYCVLELSSFQLERTFSLSPAIAIILNISSDHLDRYDDEKAYQKAKERIYKNAEIVIINREATEFAIPEAISKTFSFGLTSSNTDFGLLAIDGRRFLSYADEALLATDELPLIGEHNVSNALAVLACISALDLDLHDASRALLGFKGLPHRTELVAEINGVRYINDSKATNAGATLAAVDGDLDQIILIAGGDAKNADLKPLLKALRGKLKASILLGKDAIELEGLLSPLAQSVQVASIEEAVEQAYNISASGDTVLLSPACSSLDMFDNYIERGERFTAAVLDIEEGLLKHNGVQS